MQTSLSLGPLVRILKSSAWSAVILTITFSMFSALHLCSLPHPFPSAFTSLHVQILSVLQYSEQNTISSRKSSWIPQLDLISQSSIIYLLNFFTSDYKHPIFRTLADSPLCLLSLWYARSAANFFFAFSFLCTSGVANDEWQERISNLLLSGEALPEVILSPCFPSPCWKACVYPKPITDPSMWILQRRVA